MALRSTRKREGLGQVLLRRPAVTATLLALFILVGVYFLLIAPLLARVGSGGPDDLRPLLVSASAAEEKLRNTQSLIAAASGISRESRQKVDLALPRTPEIPELLAAVDSMAGAAGVLIAAVDVSEQKDGLKDAADIGVLNLAVNLVGSDYYALKRLLAQFEHSLRLVDVVAVAANPRAGTSAINLRAYYLRRSAAAQ